MKTKIIVNGLNGRMARAMVKAIIASENFELIPLSLTGPEVKIKDITVGGYPIKLLGPEEKNYLLTEEWPDIIIDFTTAEAVLENLPFYEANKLPFIMATSGVDLKLVQTSVMRAGTNAIFVHNLAKEITAFQAMVEFAAKQFPETFREYTLKVYGQQKRKVKLTQKIPPNFWNHSESCKYSLVKEDGSVFLELLHDAGKTDQYVDGCFEAIKFLTAVEKFSMSRGKTYFMTDVLCEEYKKFKNL